MKEIIRKIVSIITSFFMGVTFTPKDETPFLVDNYYQEEVQEKLDYRQLYEQVYSVGKPSLSDSGKEDHSVYSSTKGQLSIVGNGTRYSFFIETANYKFAEVVADAELVSDDRGPMFYIFRLPKDAEIVAPVHLTMTKGSYYNSGTTYPEDYPTMGSYVVLRSDTYSFAFGSLSRLWCDVNGIEPSRLVDEDPNKPVYETHSYLEKDLQFPAGSVIGYAGMTGMDKARRELADNQFSYFTLKITRADGTFVTLDEFYSPVN